MGRFGGSDLATAANSRTPERRRCRSRTRRLSFIHRTANDSKAASREEAGPGISRHPSNKIDIEFHRRVVPAVEKSRKPSRLSDEKSLEQDCRPLPFQRTVVIDQRENCQTPPRRHKPPYLSTLIFRLQSSIMTWELTRRRFARSINSKFIFGRIVRSPLKRRHHPPGRPRFPVAFCSSLLSASSSADNKTDRRRL